MNTGRFRISIRLRHPSLDPKDISTAFDLKPEFSWKAGSSAGKVIHKCSVWYSLLTEGAGSEQYEEALNKSILLIESRQEWLRNVLKSEGELDVIFSYWTELDEGVVCQTVFYPELLARLSRLNFGMQIESGKKKKKKAAPIELAALNTAPILANAGPMHSIQYSFNKFTITRRN